MSKQSVAIVGAGIAGLAAGAALASKGIPVTVVEARNRIGGRIDTVRDFAGMTIERGAEFVHGRHPALIQLVEEAGLHLDERRFEPCTLRDGRDVTPSQSWDKVFEELADPTAQDVPILRRIEALVASGKWTKTEAERMRGYVEGYMAAYVERASARALSEETRAAAAIEDEHNASVREGYDTVVQRLADRVLEGGGSVLLGRPVERIVWGRGAVRLDLAGGAGGAAIDAARGIVTVPLGILQLLPGSPGAIAFEPPIDARLAAAGRLAMGGVLKVFLRLGCRVSELGLPELRDRLERTHFLRTPGKRIPAWWIVGDAGSPLLVGWVAGPASDRLTGLTEPEILDIATEALAASLGTSKERVRENTTAATIADWTQDPWSRGAYSWIPAGAIDAPTALAAPLEDTLFFAGEATDTAGYRGTVHGALETGLRAAEEVLESFR